MPIPPPPLLPMPAGDRIPPLGDNAERGTTKLGGNPSGVQDVRVLLCVAKDAGWIVGM